MPIDTFSRDGRDYYVRTDDGRLVSFAAGYPAIQTFGDVLATASEQDYLERQQEKLEVNPAFNRDESGWIDPDAAFSAPVSSPAVGPPPAIARPPEQLTPPTPTPGAVASFIDDAKPDPPPPVAPPFSRDGRDYWAGPDGQIFSIDAGWDPTSQYPALKPATEEQVHARDIEKRWGGWGGRLRTAFDVAARMPAEVVEGLSKAGVGAVVDELSGTTYGGDPVEAASIVPFAYTPEAYERIEANPKTAFVSALVVDTLGQVAADYALPGAGRAMAAAKAAKTVSRVARGAGQARLVAREAAAVRAQLAAQHAALLRSKRAVIQRAIVGGIMAEAGESAIDGSEFDFGDMGFYMALGGVLDPLATGVFDEVFKGFGYARDSVKGAIGRARDRKVGAALDDKDTLARARVLTKHADHVYEQQQGALDEALALIDERVSAGPEQLFTREALKKTVRGSTELQEAASLDVAEMLSRAAQVSDDEAAAAAAADAYALVDGALGKSPDAVFSALRQGWAILREVDTDSPLVRQAFGKLDEALRNAAAWGRAADNHARALAEAGPPPLGAVDIKAPGAREALARRLEQGRAVAQLTGDEALSGAVQRAERALDLADEVTAARLLPETLADEAAELRKRLDGYPERAPVLGRQLADALAKLPAAGGETWTAERAEDLLADIARGRRAGKDALGAILDAGRKARAVATGAARKQLDEALEAAQGALDEAAEAHRAARRVAEYDATPITRGERLGEWLADKAAGHVARGAGAYLGFNWLGDALGDWGGAFVGYGFAEAVQTPINRAVGRRGRAFASYLRRRVRDKAARERARLRVHPSWLERGRGPLGVGLVAAGGAAAGSGEEEGGAAAASAGLLAFFLPRGGAKMLRGMRTGAKSGFGARDRLAIRTAVHDARADLEAWLRNYATGNSHYSDPGELMRAQIDFLAGRLQRMAGNEQTDRLPDAVHGALVNEVRLINAELIEREPNLLRIAQRDAPPLVRARDEAPSSVPSEPERPQLRVKPGGGQGTGRAEGRLREVGPEEAAERARHLEVVEAGPRLLRDVSAIDNAPSDVLDLVREVYPAALDEAGRVDRDQIERIVRDLADQITPAEEVWIRRLLGQPEGYHDKRAIERAAIAAGEAGAPFSPDAVIEQLGTENLNAWGQYQARLEIARDAGRLEDLHRRARAGQYGSESFALSKPGKDGRPMRTLGIDTDAAIRLDDALAEEVATTIDGYNHRASGLDAEFLVSRREVLEDAARRYARAHAGLIDEDAAAGYAAKRYEELAEALRTGDNDIPDLWIDDGGPTRNQLVPRPDEDAIGEWLKDRARELGELDAEFDPSFSTDALRRDAFEEWSTPRAQRVVARLVEDERDVLEAAYDSAHAAAQRAHIGVDLDELRAMDLDVDVRDANGMRNVFGDDIPDASELRKLFGIDALDEYGEQSGKGVVERRLRINDDSVHFEARTGNGRDRMHIEMAISAGFDDDLDVHFAYMVLPESAQGQGIGTRVFGNVVDFIESRGNGEVSFSAAWVGKYVWLKLGGVPRDEMAISDCVDEFLVAVRDAVGDEHVTYAALSRSVRDTRDVADATIPIGDIEAEALAHLENRWARSAKAMRGDVNLDIKPFDEVFIRDDQFLAGKFFLLTQRGSWNDDLVVRVDGSEWFEEFKRRAGLIGTAGLVGISAAELAEAMTGSTWQLDSSESAAAAGVGGLWLLFGGRGKARLFAERHRMLGRDMVPDFRRAVDQLFTEKYDAVIERYAQSRANADRLTMRREILTLRNEIADKAAQAIERDASPGVREFVQDYVHSGIQARLARIAAEMPPPEVPKPARPSTAAVLAEEATRPDIEAAPLFAQFDERYIDGSWKWYSVALDKLRAAFGESLDRKDLDWASADEAVRNRVARVAMAIDEGLERFGVPVVTAAAADDRLARALAGEGVDIGRLELDMHDAASLLAERQLPASATTAEHRAVRDFVDAKVRLSMAQAVARARKEFGSRWHPPLRGRGIAARAAAEVADEQWAANVRVAAKTRHTFPNEPLNLRLKVINHLTSLNVDLPMPQAAAIANDLEQAALDGEDMLSAVEDIARRINEDARGLVLDPPKQGRLSYIFNRFARRASADLGFDVERAIRDYAGDWDYKDINHIARTGDALHPQSAIDRNAKEWVGSDHAEHRRDIHEKAERLQMALDYAVTHGLTAPGQVWRGVLMTSEEIAAIENAAVVEAKAFMSTSADRHYPLEFMQKKKQLSANPSLIPIVFEVHQHSGVPVNPGEAEIMLRAGTRFRVERFRDAAGAQRVRLVELDADTSIAPKDIGAVLGDPSLPWIAGGLAVVGAAAGEDEAEERRATAAELDARDAEREILDDIERGAELRETVLDAREDALDETRERLTYLSTAARAAIEDAARALAGRAPAPRRVERTPGVTASTGIAGFMGGHPSLHEAYTAKREKLEQVAREPMKFLDELAEAFDELSDRAPALHSQIVARTFKAAEYLRGKLPEVRGVSLTRPAGAAPDALAMRQFALYWSAATDPASVVTDLANNRARREQVEALREVWPETYGKVTAAVLEEMSRARPRYSQRVRIDLLFGFGEDFDRALSPGLSLAAEAYRKQARERAEAGPGASPRTPSRRSQPSVEAASAFASLSRGAAGNAV